MHCDAFEFQSCAGVEPESTTYARDRLARHLFEGGGGLVAGGRGVRTGRVYTSLTGFMNRDDPELSNVGKLQLFRLGEWLREDGFAFWNLGHPYMQYKIDLGGAIVQRPDFLRRLRGEGGIN